MHPKVKEMYGYTGYKAKRILLNLSGIMEQYGRLCFTRTSV
jgi:hypothetical protein